MATEAKCGKRPELKDFLAGNVLFEEYPWSYFRDPATKPGKAWNLIGHPLAENAGQWKSSRAAACAAGTTLWQGETLGGGSGSASACYSSKPTWGMQMKSAQAAWADYQSRVESFYAAYAKWLDTSDPSFIERLECYDNQDLLTIFSMLGELAGLSLTSEEQNYLLDIADGAVCPYLAQEALDAPMSGQRSENLDNYIRAINALAASGPNGVGLYAWLVAPHMVESYQCVEALWSYDSAMVAKGIPLAESSAALALEAAPAPPGGPLSLGKITVAMRSKPVKGRLRLEKAPGLQSMAPPPEEKAREYTDRIQEMLARDARASEDMKESMVQAGEDQYARFLEVCAEEGRGEEHTDYLARYRGGSRVWCPPLPPPPPEPPPEDKRPNLALILGIGGLLAGGPVGGIAGGAVGAWLDQQAAE